MIRPAQKGDEFGIFELIKALALYEKAPEQVSNTAQQLGIDLFEDQICEAIVAEEEGRIIGFALWYTSYSTWKGRCLYLEDFYVLPEYREKKIGSQLFDQVVEIAKKRGVKRMDWQVLEWNELALRFYERKQAILDPEWVNGRLFFD
ncbi:MAG: GNAT family N-acetyltransferase [Bacteroidetes bacterium]|nr:MAG: GNAT family N-acetyltransferase [Bacteroidota bacterium]